MDTFYNILKHTHGGFRYLLLLVVTFAIIRFILGWTKNRNFSVWDKRGALWTLILSHLQLVTGLVLYFISPANYPNELASGPDMKNTVFRYFAVEHLMLMLVAIAVLTVGYSRAKRANQDFKKFKILLWSYAISAAIISLSLYMKVYYGA